MDHLVACDALEGEIELFAGRLHDAPMQAAISSCPGWSIGDLALHLGTVHRWAEYLIKVRAPASIPSSEMNLSTGPADAQWIRSGGASLVSTLRTTDPATAMWAWGADQHAAFWSRRQLHETLVHRTDLEQALGIDPKVDAAIAADAVDEFLVNLPMAAHFSPNVTRLRGNGERLAFVSFDTDRSWNILLSPEGFTVGDVNEQSMPPAVSIIGHVLPLLLVLYRRRSPAEVGVAIEGNRELADFWLANSALE